MSTIEDDRPESWALVAKKREWCPEWLWRRLGQLPVREPWRTIFVRDLTPEEACNAWEGDYDQ